MLAERHLLPRSFAAVLAVLPAAVVSTVALSEERFDIATFEPPPGWERVASPGVLLFRAAAGDGQIALFSSFASDASPAENFAAEWAKLVAAASGSVEPQQVTTEQTPDGWTALIGAANVARDGATFAVVQVTTTGFGRVMTVVASLASADRGSEVTRFFEQIEFRSEASSGSPEAGIAQEAARAERAQRPDESANTLPIAHADAANGPPVGLFYRVAVGALSGGRVDVETRLFLAGNRVTRTFPFGGGDTFDAARCAPDTCGTYELGNEMLVVRWDGGRTDRWLFQRTAEGISLDGTTFRPARPISETALVGEWSGGQDVGNPFANVYRFQRDGAFSFGSGQTRVAGRYWVQGLTLVLDFADGSETRRTLFAAGAGDPVGLISVDGDVYSRR